jgi:hypothetical protein
MGKATVVAFSPPDVEIGRELVGQAEVGGGTLWTGRLPEPALGQPMDYRVLIEAADGTSTQWPEGGPVIAASVKRSAARVTGIPTTGRVLDLVPFEDGVWLAVEGGGVRRIQNALLRDLWTVGTGMPSNVARQVLADPPAGRVFAATDRGLVGIDVLSRGALRVDIDVDGIWGRGWRIHPAVLSPLDGSILFQARLEEAPPGTEPVFWQLTDGRLIRWEHGSGRVDWTAGTFDSINGCYLFGGVSPVSQSTKELVVYERCGVQEKRWRFQNIPGQSGSTLLQLVIGLDRDPVSGDIVLVASVRDLAPSRTVYPLLRLDEDSGLLVPFPNTLTRFDEEITGLTTDSRRDRLLLSTIGRGVLEIRNEIARPVSTDDRVANASAVRVDPATGSVLVGTQRDAYRLDEQGNVAEDLDPSSKTGVPADALPMDVRGEPGDERVLVSSYSRGLFELKRNGRAWVMDREIAGGGIPSGGYGVAVYGRDREVWAVLSGDGLLKISLDGSSTRFGKNDGLDSPYVDNILTLGSGVLWVAQNSLLPPSGGEPGIFELEEAQTRRVRGADGVGTVARWVEARDRESIWAATNGGVVEIHRDGTINRLSGFLAASLARNNVTGESGNVGTAIERWDGTQFRGLPFRLRHPRVPRRYTAGAPIDLAIGSDGRWAILYVRGVVALLDPSKAFSGLLDWEDGIPSRSVRLFFVPGTNEIFCGTSGEGLVSIQLSAEN